MKTSNETPIIYLVNTYKKLLYQGTKLSARKTL